MISLARLYPKVAAEWHPTRNADLRPDMVPAAARHRAWWQCTHGHEWEAPVGQRTGGTGCPYCSGLPPVVGVTDLATTHPVLAGEWHPTRNGTLTPTDVRAGSARRVWWLCPRGHDWIAPVDRRSRGHGCAKCSGRQVDPGVTDLATTHPAVAAEWHPIRNGVLSARRVTAGSERIVWWQCSDGHEWQARVFSRTAGRGCPDCQVERRVQAAGGSFATVHPELAAEWHPTRNDTTPHRVAAGSRKRVWWQAACGHEFESRCDHRVRRPGCPACKVIARLAERRAA